MDAKLGSVDGFLFLPNRPVSVDSNARLAIAY